jgi:hypothetical protein
VSDLDNDTITLSTSLGLITDNGDGTWSWSFASKDGPAESQEVTITAVDGVGGVTTTNFYLAVNNIAPTIDIIAVPPDPIDINDQASFSINVTFSDPAGAEDEFYTCDFDIDNDGVIDEVLVNITGSSCEGTFAYTQPGVYLVRVTVTDKDGGSGSATTAEYVVIFDSDGGFVTGGGWIESPEGAYVSDPSLTGHANFGFVSKYKKGAHIPTGVTEFQFRVADLNFHSNTYDWLIIAGPKAKFKGTGTINRTGNYGFMITGIDENLTNSTDVDLFRIKIWDKDNDDVIIYDNLLGEPDDADPVSASIKGNIVIHKVKNVSTNPIQLISIDFGYHYYFTWI